MRRRITAGISHVADFSARDENWPAYATLRREPNCVAGETQWSDEVVPVSVVGSLSARADPKLGQDVGDVGAGRGSADEERFGNFRVGAAGDEET